MKATHRVNLFLTVLVLALTTLLSLVGCTATDRIVIDGDAVLRMESALNEQLQDTESSLRGNTSSNMRNGGYVALEGETVWFTVDMRFEDGSESHYLQKLHRSQIGSINARDDLVASFDGIIVGSYGTRLIHIDKEQGNILCSLDTVTYELDRLFDVPVAHAHLHDHTVYVSTEGQGDLYAIELSQEAGPTLLYANGGQLVGISGGMAFMLGSTEGSSVIRRFDLQRRMVAQRIVGGPYHDIQVSGSWLYYKDGLRLMRQPIAGGNAVLALHRDIMEYAVGDGYLAFTSPKGGIFFSKLDGTGIVQLASDEGKGLQLIGSRLFYRNSHDRDTIYVIDLVEGKRTALVGETLTDGGMRFEMLQDRAYEEQYGTFVRAVSSKHSAKEQYLLPVPPNMLFAEVTEDGSIRYYRYVEDEFDPEKVKSLVVISFDPMPLGQYTDGGIAYRLDRKVTLFLPDHEEPLLSLGVEGRAPSEIKTSAGDRYGLAQSWYQRGLEIRSLVVPQ